VNAQEERLIAAGILPPPPPTKRCRHCGSTKARADFKHNVRVSDGLSSWCRACHNESTKAWKARKAAADPSWRAAEYERARQRGNGGNRE
jgi:hypothetical protein